MATTRQPGRLRSQLPQHAPGTSASKAYGLAKIYVLFLPSVWIAMTNRNVDVMGVSTPFNKDQLWLPVSVWLKAMPQLDVGVARGIKGPIDKFGDNYTVPAGVLGQFSINKQLAVGTSWVFGKITGASALNTGTEFRGWPPWVTYKM